MASRELAGRTALVTGGSRGIGRAVCVRLAREGARVAINYASSKGAARETERLVREGARVAINYASSAGAARETERLVREEGAECVLVEADVSDPAAVAGMVAAAERALGPIDLLVSSAVIAPSEARGEVSFATWRRIMAVNLDGTFLPVMAVKDGMIARGFGRIVCFASIAGLRPRPAMLAYSTSKAAVIGFARSCSEACAPQVRINGIAPGLIDTDMPAASLDQAARQRMIDATPLKRIAGPRSHRVLAAGGKVGGFSANGGIATKLRLLSIEGARTSAAPTLFEKLPLMAPRRR